MKKILPWLFIFVFSGFSSAQIINWRLSTSLYSFKKYDTIGVSNSYYRAFQTLQFDVTKDRYSFNTLIQGNTNLYGDVEEVNSLKIYNMYFRIKKIFNILDLNIGRQYVFGGVANGLIDGSALRFYLLNNRLIIKGFAGANVNKDLKADFQNNLKNNYLLGLQFVGNPIENLNLSVSYFNRHRERINYSALRPDTLGFVYDHTVKYNSSAEQFWGADLDFESQKYGRIFARYDYDLNLQNTSRIQFGAKVKITEKVFLTGEYINRTPRLYFNSIFYVFQSNNTEEIEGGFEYLYKPSLRIFTKFAHIWYSDDKTNRFTVGLTTGYGSLTYSGSTGFSGELSSVSGQIYYPLLERKLVPTVSVAHSSYKLTKNSDRFESFSGVFGVAVNMIRSISFDVQLHWLSNRVYKNDVRLLLKANYFFTQNINIL